MNPFPRPASRKARLCAARLCAITFLGAVLLAPSQQVAAQTAPLTATQTAFKSAPGPNPQADAAAYALLKAAYQARQVLPTNFAGFDADVVFYAGGRNATGKFHFRGNGQSRLEIVGLSADDLQWLQHNALSLANHRREGDFDEAEGKYPLRFGAAETTAFGRLIERGDAQKLSSRVKDGKILELTRTMGDKRFIISVLETMTCDAGKYIPTRYLVSYLDPQSGALQNVEMFENKYAKIEGLWLPIGRKVVSVDHNAGAGLRERSFQFENIRLAR